MNRRVESFLLLLACVSAISCSQHVTTDDGVPQPPLTRQGSLSAIAYRFLAPENVDPVEQFSFMAVFPSYFKRENTPLDSIVEAHVPEVDLPLDHCSSPEPEFSSITRDTPGESSRITLLDVGDLFLTQGAMRIGIPTRTFPDLLQVVDGVMYTASHRNGLMFLPGQNYTVRTTGTEKVAVFETVLEAPEDLGDVRINGVSPGEQTPTVTAGQLLSITWEGVGYGDEVIARMKWSSMGLAWEMHCRMRDDGAFSLTGDMTRRMSNGGNSRSDFEMTLSRVRQISFRARGLDFGDFNFVASTNFFFRFEESQ